MAHKVDILRNRVFAMKGHRSSVFASNWQIPMKRDRLDCTSYEDEGKFSAAGDYALGDYKVDGWGSPADIAIWDALANETETVPVTILRESDVRTLGGPFAAPGSPALFWDGNIYENSGEAKKGALKAFSATCTPNGRPYFGVTLYTNAGAAPLDDSTVFVSESQNLGSLGAGMELAATCHVLDVPGLLGTSPTVTAALVSDSHADLSTAVVQYTFPVFNSPNGFFIRIDGDVNPVPSEPYWGIQFTLAGTTPLATVISAIALVAKT